MVVAAADLKGSPLTVTSTCTLARPPQVQGHVQTVKHSLLPLWIGARAGAVAVLLAGGTGGLGAATGARTCSGWAVLTTARGAGAGFFHTYFPGLGPGLGARASRSSVRRRQSPHSRPKHGKSHFSQGVFLDRCHGESSRLRRPGRRSSPLLPASEPFDFLLSGIVSSQFTVHSSTVHGGHWARRGAG